MPKFIVKVEGKLLVQAESKEAAIERANVHMADVGLPSFKASNYDSYIIDDTTVVPA